jgi:hypothetical protein
MLLRFLLIASSGSAPQVKRSSNDSAYEALAQWAVVLER